MIAGVPEVVLCSCECWLLPARPFNSSHNKDGGGGAVVVSTDC